MSRKSLLDKIQVNSPCEADWYSMIGNDQVRFCEHCSQTVRDLSQLTRKRALRLVTTSKGRLCVRYHRRPDGSLVTKSVPQKFYSIGRRASRIAAGAFTATLSLTSAVAQSSPTEQSGSSHSISSPQEPGRQVYLGANVFGTVTDPHGAVIPDATVSIANAQNNFALSASSNEEGAYRFDNLEPGTYDLRIEAPGFTPADMKGILLTSNADQRLNQGLEVAGIQEVVEVPAEELTVAGGMAMPAPSNPLVKAAFEDDLQELESLLASSNVNLRDKETGSTSLEYAVRNGNREMVQVLLRGGAELNSRNEAKQTVLMMLGEECTSDIVWDLIHAGAKVNLKDEDGDTPLIEAAMVNNVGVLNVLLHAGAKVDDRNNQGQTAFMLAAEQGLTKNVRALIIAGADMNARDHAGKTALTYAKENDHQRVVKLLQSFGAIEGDVVKEK